MPSRIKSPAEQQIDQLAACNVSGRISAAILAIEHGKTRKAKNELLELLCFIEQRDPEDDDGDPERPAIVESTDKPKGSHMHKLTDEEKAQIGGKLARIFGLKLEPESGRYLLGEGYHTKTALGVFEVVHDVCCERPRKDDDSSNERK